ncbi:hypothetical protein L226DRAFT_524080 [Lentinus tigrinus ALCF2SS1-7]|uniref:Uncharacterized protein n=1 Tax=Lentinus tigrinus ALCF2SS1-6 TaxID=1328759 RepID=A0A5C2S7L6_9APHY|nr:hypothetical protein L227DRAFT_504231 [Lentinus tigrinus ALCF2SS1-6]RPD73240.1 hypothetical protein L226DRAFT_524080 [Lentinus tigrinus ALCF2SS1-7]
MQFATIFYAFAMLFVCAFAAPLEVRQETVSNVKCTSTTALDFHTSNVALLQICGGIAGSIQKCQGAPTSTTGQSGNVRFTITPVVKGDVINISKGRWEQGIKAAFAVCGQNIPFTATFTGGAAKGDVNVVYEKV